MRNGKNILRMQADEEDVYHLMVLGNCILF